MNGPPSNGAEDMVLQDNDPTKAAAEQELADCFCADGIRGPPHSEFCQKIQSLVKQVRESTASLKDGALLDIDSSLFPPLFTLCDALFKAANSHGSQRLAEEELFYFMQCIGRSRDLRWSVALENVPFVLVQLERYDELWAFCHFFFPQRRWALSDDQRRLAQSGQFPFRAEEGTHLLNVGDAYNRDTLQGLGTHVLPFLVALYLMKVKVLVRRQQERKEFAEMIDLFLHTDQGQVLEQVSPLLQELAKGSRANLDPQELLIETLMDIINERNVTILPAMIFPGPLRQGIYGDDMNDHDDDNMDGLHFPRCPAEAWVTLMACRGELARTPKAKEILQARFGEQPEYHHSPFDG